MPETIRPTHKVDRHQWDANEQIPKKLNHGGNENTIEVPFGSLENQ